MTADSHAAHIRNRVAAALLVADPGPHMVIPELLPADVYALLLETMPPPEGFDIADKMKANFDPENAYQFYIGPAEPDLARLVLRMPVDQQAAWRKGMTAAADAGD